MYWRIINRLSKGRINLAGTKRAPHIYGSVNELLEWHFNNNTNANHPCRATISRALHMLNEKPANILETGSSAWGANSSLLFDAYVSSFGGYFYTVDIRLQPALRCRKICSSNTMFYCDDSVKFLKNFAYNQKQFISLCYLDSMDVNWKDPLPSMLHGLNEYLAISSILKAGSLLLVDDTPQNEKVMKETQPKHIDNFLKYRDSEGIFPGKGALINLLLQQIKRGKKVAHDYQLLWQF